MLRSFVTLAGSALAALALSVAGASGGPSAAGSFPVTVVASNGKVTVSKRPSPHRLALADGDRDALRDRRGLAGRRRRRPVRLPEERSADVALGLHPERRGDRRLPARPRRHRVRPEGPVGRAPAARHHRAPPGRREELQGRVPADPPARDGHRSRRRGGEARLRHEVEDRRHREEGARRVGRGSPCTTS